MEQNVVLEMRGINKNFPGVKALQDVDFTLRKGEIHALMGENGAGKSTLIKVLTGVEEFETGTIRMEGSSNTIINRSPQEAQENGISTVYQEVNLCPNLSVAENLYIGREPKKGPMIDWRTMKEDARKLLEGLDVHIDVTMAVENYSIAIQQMIAIARAVDMSAKVLILDEPTPGFLPGTYIHAVLSGPPPHMWCPSQEPCGWLPSWRIRVPGPQDQLPDRPESGLPGPGPRPPHLSSSRRGLSAPHLCLWLYGIRGQFRPYPFWTPSLSQRP